MPRARRPMRGVLVDRGGGIVIVSCISRLDPWIGLKWKWRDYVRECIVRQPCRTVIGEPARPHPVTRRAGTRWLQLQLFLSFVIPYCERLPLVLTEC